MKQLTITLILLLVGVSTVLAQPRKGMANEKIEAFRVEFFTQRLALTDEEAKVFWPVYNAYQKDLRILRTQQRNLHKKNKGDVSDEVLEESIEKHFEIRQKQLDLERQYYKKFKKVLPMKKLAKLSHVERAFKSELLKKMKAGRKK